MKWAVQIVKPISCTRDIHSALLKMKESSQKNVQICTNTTSIAKFSESSHGNIENIYREKIREKNWKEN